LANADYTAASCGKKTILKLKKENCRIEVKVILPCIALGLAPFIMYATESLIAVCFNASLLKYGGDIAVGAMTILTSVMQFSMLPLLGLTQGTQPIISYNFGAKNVQRVKEAFFILLKCSVIFSASLWLFIMLFLALLRKVILLIPLIYILPLIFTNQTMAIYLAEPIADIIAVTVTGTMFVVQFRKTLKSLIDPKSNQD
jgi:Na+-driven multidrug efflux pump